MPLPKGDPRLRMSKGRKGYEYEKKDLERMSKLLRSFLTLAEKKELKPGQLEYFNRIEKLVLKVMDKLHANKQETDITTQGEKIIIMPSELINEHQVNTNTSDSSE